MAEDGTSTTIYANTCPFCDQNLSSQFVLGKHLLEVHNICVNTKLKRSHVEDATKEHVFCTATVNSGALTLGNKMRTLRCILKENFSQYTEKLKDWINCDISRTEFDQSVFPLFSDDTIVIHTEFLICFMKAIRSVNESSVSIIKQRINFASMPPGAVFSSANRSSSSEANQLSSSQGNPTFCLNKIIADDAKNLAVKRTLADEETMYALALVHAWENGCTAVNKKVVPVLQNTAETIIKIIRDSVITRRKTLKMRPDGSIYDITKVDPKDWGKEDKFVYTGDFDVNEIVECLKAEPSLIPFKALSKVISEIMNFEKNKRL